MYAALIRGINVGGNKIVPMAELVKMFAALKCTGVRTYVNSGNVVFSAPAATAKKVPVAIGAAIDKKLGFTPAIVVRTATELAAVVADNPFPNTAGKELHVAFLADAPPPANLAGITPGAGEKLVLRGKHLYMFMPRGVGQTKLSNTLLEKKLGTVATMRNWNTVAKLAEMTGSS
jgi:uncharacterized protein (DUF1697 family)